MTEDPRQRQLSYAEAMRTIHDQEVRLIRLEEKFCAAKAEKEKQAAEYERRLSELNHAHQKASEDKAAFLPRETFGRFEEGYLMWRDATNKILNTGAGVEAGRRALLALAISVIGTLLGAVALFLKTGIRP